jgi:hypothetical protein
MPNGYEINDLAKEESWRLFRIIGELVEGFDTLSGIEPARLSSSPIMSSTTRPRR